MPCVLCFADCHNFLPELSAAIALEGWDDVVVVGFPARCGHPPLCWEELSGLPPPDCDQLILLGRACLSGLGEPPPEFPPVQKLVQEQCFHLLAPAGLVDEAIDRGAYLLTPSWLEQWRVRLTKLGYATVEEAGELFQDCVREFLLLDTGLLPEAPRHLAELSATFGLPASRLAIGLDYLRSRLARLVAEWRLEREHKNSRKLALSHARELADRAVAMDMLGRMARSMRESEAIATIQELFLMLFAPEEFHYLRLENGIPLQTGAIPPVLLREMLACSTDHAWLASGRGFLLRIAHDGRTLGIIAADRLAFPEYRERYLNLALSIAGVLGLAIENARIHKRLVEAEKMASLGYLVAGVAHEVSTPLGVGMAAISSLREQIERLSERFAARGMTQSDLHSFLQRGLVESQLIQSNLNRIGQLVDTFRQIAVHGGAPEKTRFHLKACLDESIRSFGHRWAEHAIEVCVRCDEELEIESQRGDWCAIFVNLLANSLKHGFRERASGKIDIHIESPTERLVIDYRDDGAGMAPQILEHVFDPFFTTDLGQGMGLGLHLVYNLVTQRLGGGIGCESLPGHGVHFHLEVPR